MQHQSIAKKLFQFAIIAGLAITVYSCTDNGKTTDTIMTDSTGMRMDTMTTSPGMNSQDTMMNRNDSNNVQRHGQ
jgi:hypothetical protein